MPIHKLNLASVADDPVRRPIGQASTAMGMRLSA